MKQNSVTIKQLFVYPVKSMAGIEIKEISARSTGFAMDRQYMLVNEKGIFVTQRQIPEMVLIRPSIKDNKLIFSGIENDQEALDLGSPTKNNKTFLAKIWRDQCEVFEPDKNMSSWLSHQLKQNVKLVALAQPRPQSEPERFGSKTSTLFADAAPYLICNQASLIALNNSLIAKGAEPVDIRRFRANIVVEGQLKAFAEHKYSKLNAGNFSFTLIDHCQRCIVTTIDPDKGIKNSELEPFKTVTNINPMPNSNSPAFGVNATWHSTKGSDLVETLIRVGDVLRLT